ncbi:unnamed protein product [Caenorhabditis bovis]|uniref:Gamma-secretase subunit PEN-2 n=1 Tax=Caenorhabditis bovis TaxID=2654633 RepID=A0A8S1FDQ7_9PELO|nr:unnamed protein product [Caenorhabditis bovis]
MSDEKKLDLCKKYFLIGACFLPFVWLTNFFWFFSDAFVIPRNVQRVEMRKYVVGSGIGTIFWLIIILSWEIIFQLYRDLGIEWADYLTFVFPKGRV